MFYRNCDGCYARIKYSNINFVKGYMENGNYMSEQWLCDKCLSIHTESRISYISFEKWEKKQAKKKEEEE